MKQTLDNVIRTIDEAEAKNLVISDTKKLILIDKKTGKHLKKKPLFDFRGTLVRYIVHNDRGSDNIARSEITTHKIVDKKGEISVNFTLIYFVRCPMHNEFRVAEGLFDVEKTPSVILEEHLIRAMHNFMDERYPQNADAFCRDYPRSKELMQDYIEQYITKVSGLHTEIQIKIHNEDNIKDEYRDKHISIMPNDSDEYIKVHFKANLQIEKLHEIYAMVHHAKRNNLESILEKEIKYWCRKHGTMHDIVYGSNILKSNLITYLNTVLIQYGYVIDFLTLNPDESMRMPEFKPLKHNVKAEIRQYGEVRVENQFDVEPIRQEILTYRSNKFTTFLDVEKHLKLLLDKIIEKELFKLSYIDVLTKVVEFQEDVHQQFREQAKGIGYSVKLFSSIPDLEPLSLVHKGFTISLSDIEQASGEQGNVEFATKSNFVKVRLDIRVSGKLKDLTLVENHLIERVNLLDLIRNKIRQVAEEILLRTAPDEFYLHFEHGENQQESVKDRIIKRVSAVLRTEFGVSVSSMIPILLETELQRNMFALLKQKGHFSVSISSLRDNKDEFILRGDFRVVNVDPNNFQVFLMQQPAYIESIQDSLARSLADRLNMLSAEELEFFSVEHYKKMLDLIQKMTNEMMSRQFGIQVDIDNIGRERTHFEEAMHKSKTEYSISQIGQIEADKHNMSEINKLKIANRFSDLVSKNQDIDAIRESIRRLRENAYTSPEELEDLVNREKKLVEERDALEESISKQVSVSDQSLDSLSRRPDRVHLKTDLLIAPSNTTLGDGNTTPGDATLTEGTKEE
jgi:hypothetical protein